MIMRFFRMGPGWRATLWVSVWIGFDLAVRRCYPGHSNTAYDPALYAAGVVLSWLGVRWCLELLGRVESALLRILATVVPAVTAASVMVGSGYLFRFFGEYFTGGGVLFVVSEPAYINDYLNTFLTPLSALGALLAVGSFLVLLVPRYQLPGQRWRLTTLVLSLAAFLGGVTWLSRDSLQVPPDVAALCSIRQAIRLGVKRIHLQKVPRAMPSLAGAEAPWANTILLVVNESWGTSGVAFAGSQRNGMTLLERRVVGDSAWVAFPHAFTNATATDVSMPSIFTGSRTDESWDRLHAYPFPWDVARKRGFLASYVTSQRLKWLHMDQFLFPHGIDELWSMETLGAPTVNDAGVDDNISVRKLVDLVRRTPLDKPLFLVWNSNSLHGPFQEASDFVKTDTIEGGRWYKAQHILDVALDTLLNALQQRGRLQEALVVVTGDHGEIENPHHRPARIYNYYDEIVRIPFLVHAPRSWDSAHPQAVRNLRANREVNVQNLDIAPMLAQVLGLKTDRKNDSLFVAWKGASLLEPVAPDRTIQVLSANDIHTGNREGFGLVKGNQRFVLSSLEGVKFFDIGKDPQQDTDLWGGMGAKEQGVWLDFIRSNALMTRIYKSTRALLESEEAQRKRK